MLLTRSGKPKQHEIGVAIGLDRRFNLLYQPLQGGQKFSVGTRILPAFLDLLSQVADLLQRQRDFSQSRSKLGGQAKLPHHCVLRSFHTRVQLDRQRLRATLAVRRELHGVVARHCQRSGRSPERSANTFRQRVTKIPYESVHSCLGQKRLRVAQPVELKLHVIWVGLVQFVVARKSSHQLSFRVEDLQLDGGRGFFLQVIIQHRSFRRVRSQSLIHRHRRALI